VGMQRAVAGRPLVPGIKTRVARQRIAQLGQIAATQLEEAAIRERDLARAEQLRAWARQLATASPHQLRHSLRGACSRQGRSFLKCSGCLAIADSRRQGSI